MTTNDDHVYGLPTIVLFGDDSSDDKVVPLKRMAVIDLRDMDALWDGLGIDTSDWLPTDPYGTNNGVSQEYPMLYAAQGFVAFQREYNSQQLDELIAECRRGQGLVKLPAAKRSAQMLLNAATVQKERNGRLLVRAGICDPSDPATCPEEDSDLLL